MLTRLPLTRMWPWLTNLAGGEDRGDELHPVDHGIQAALQQADQVLRGIPLGVVGLLEIAAELALADIAVIALQFLLGLQLQPEVGGLLAPLAVEARAVFALVEGGFGPAPEIYPETAVDLVLGADALGHVCPPRLCISYTFLMSR